ncbi:MAG: carotenoid biosynthesis protein [Terracidiphilus sp.]
MSSLPANGKHGTVALAAILAAYACARILEVSSGSIPHLWIVALDVLSAATFAAFDGSRHYRWRTILVFAAICVVVGNIVENLGVATGFPFGRYYFVELMGPKVFHVPVLLGLAYIGMAYVSWMLASLILKTPPSPATTRSIIAIPLLASLIMTTWDLAQDPVWSTILRGWIWRDGGAWFGVPISNYLGWYANVLVIYLLFALYLRRRGPAATISDGAALWPAPVFYALCALGNILQLASRSVPAVVTDPTGKSWTVSQIVGASALVSVACMGTYVYLGWRTMATCTQNSVREQA